MLKASVCLGRKISRDYNSTNYTVSIEADIPASPDQPDEVQKHIHRLFVLAEKSLGTEIDRDQSEQNIGRHDEEPASNGRHQPPQNDRGPARSNGNGHGSNGNGQAPTNGQHEEPASQKQVNYIFNLAKRIALQAAARRRHSERARSTRRRGPAHEEGGGPSDRNPGQQHRRERSQVIARDQPIIRGGTIVSRLVSCPHGDSNEQPDLELFRSEPIPSLPLAVLLSTGSQHPADVYARESCIRFLDPRGTRRLSSDAATRRTNDRRSGPGRLPGKLGPTEEARKDRVHGGCHRERVARQRRRSPRSVPEGAATARGPRRRNDPDDAGRQLRRANCCRPP